MFLCFFRIVLPFPSLFTVMLKKNSFFILQYTIRLECEYQRFFFFTIQNTRPSYHSCPLKSKNVLRVTVVIGVTLEAGTDTCVIPTHTTT